LDILKRIHDENDPPLIVAELSANHGGQISKAIQLVHAAVSAGADAIKLQTYKPDTITVNGRDARFKIASGLWKGRFLHDLYEDAMTPWEWHPRIAEEVRKLGKICFSSPFDESAVEFLENFLDPPLYKIASFELNHIPLLECVAKTKKPVLASVGVSSKEEIESALSVLKSFGCPEVVLLHCVSEYPAKPADFCLQKMPLLKIDFGVEYGLSDHSPGHIVPVVATSLGARIIEKHFCLDRDEETIDGAFSMLPEEFREMKDAVDLAHQAISGKRRLSEAHFYKRSILVSSPIRKGDLFTVNNIRIARPGDGLCPSKWEKILGEVSNKDLPVGHPLSDRDIAG